jgi:hypothetical protein
MDAFDAVRREHAAMSAEAYNNDHVYKQKLNQVRVMERRKERKEGISARCAQMTIYPEPFQK